MNAPELDMQLKHQIAELKQAMACNGVHPETLRDMKQKYDELQCAYRGIVTLTIDLEPPARPAMNYRDVLASINRDQP